MHLYFFVNHILPFIIAAVLLVIEGLVIRRIFRNRNRRAKTVAINDISTITTGQKVEVNEFAATVVEVNSFDGTIKVKDANANVHYLSYTQLTKVLPFEDGAVYLDAYNDRYTWVAADRGWLNKAGNPRDFAYPVRPLRKYTLSATELTD